MTMERVFHPIHYIAGFVALALMGVDIYTNLEFIHEQTKSWSDSSVFAVVAIALAAPLVLTVSFKALKAGQVMTGLMLLGAYVAAAGFSLSATLGRVSAQYDTLQAARWEKDKPMTDLVELYKRVQYVAARECASGRGEKCDKIEGEVKVAKLRIEQRQLELDSLAQRLSAALPFISVKQAAMYQPWLLPLSLFFMSHWLLVFATQGYRKPKEFNVELTGHAAVQARVHRFVDQYRATNGKVPTTAEIARGTGVSHYIANKARAQIGR